MYFTWSSTFEVMLGRGHVRWLSGFLSNASSDTEGGEISGELPSCVLGKVDGIDSIGSRMAWDFRGDRQWGAAVRIDVRITDCTVAIHSYGKLPIANCQTNE